MEIFENIPTYDNGTWTVTDFSSREEFAKFLRDLFKEYCDLKNDFSAVKFFLQFDSSLYKSKYIMKFLNSNKKMLTV
jgi:hypothetical protein